MAGFLKISTTLHRRLAEETRPESGELLQVTVNGGGTSEIATKNSNIGNNPKQPGNL